MLPLENELLRLKILWELYQDLFGVCDYKEIKTQKYKIACEDISDVLAAIYYLDDRGFIDARGTNDKNVLIIYIKSRGIDDIEDRWRQGNILLFGSLYANILIRQEQDENCGK